MEVRQRQVYESWAMRSKPQAFAFLIGLALAISAALIGSVAAVATITGPQIVARHH